MSFRFGLRPPKAVSTLRDFNARGRQSRPCAKVFTCGENACTAHSRRRPEGRVGAVLSACREFENIQIVVTSQKERHDQRSCLSFWQSVKELLFSRDENRDFVRKREKKSEGTWVLSCPPAPNGQFFQVHGSILQPDPSCN